MQNTAKPSAAPARSGRGRPPRDGYDVTLMAPETAEIYRRIVDGAGRAGMTLPEMLSAAGLGRDTVRDWTRNKSSIPSLGTLRRIAGVLQCRPAWLAFGDDGPADATQSQSIAAADAPLDAFVPVIGVANGAVLGSGPPFGETVDYVARPPALRHARDAYAVYVQGDSMIPEHRPGDVRFIHRHRPPRPGDSVLLQEIVPGTNHTRAFIKILKSSDSEFITTVQHNPFLEVKFRSSGIVALHKVLSTAELVSL